MQPPVGTAGGVGCHLSPVAVRINLPANFVPRYNASLQSAARPRFAAFFTGDNRRMADPNDRVPGQVPGRYYVDTQCIDCDLCRETAPANFQRNDEEGFSYVYKQPETPEEETLSKDALDNCPVEAIGNDG